jgi:hypothetical protein
LALGAAFLRAARFSFLRSCVSSILVVSATCNLFHCNLFRVSRTSGRCAYMLTGIFRRRKRVCVLAGGEWPYRIGRTRVRLVTPPSRWPHLPRPLS